MDPEHEVEGWHPIVFPASIMDGEGLSEGAEAARSRHKRQGGAFRVRCAGAREGIRGHHRRAAILGPSPSCDVQASCAGVDPCKGSRLTPSKVRE